MKQAERTQVKFTDELASCACTCWERVSMALKDSGEEFLPVYRGPGSIHVAVHFLQGKVIKGLLVSGRWLGWVTRGLQWVRPHVRDREYWGRSIWTCLWDLCVHQKTHITDEVLNNQVDSMTLPISQVCSQPLGCQGAQWGVPETWDCDYHWVPLDSSGQEVAGKERDYWSLCVL